MNWQRSLIEWNIFFKKMSEIDVDFHKGCCLQASWFCFGVFSNELIVVKGF